MRGWLRPALVSCLAWVAASGCGAEPNGTSGMCHSDSDCHAGQSCSDGRCRGCSADVDCASGLVCVRAGSRSACVTRPVSPACSAPADYCAAARGALGTSPVVCVGDVALDCSSSAPACTMCAAGCTESGCARVDGGAPGVDAGAGDDAGTGGEDASATPDADSADAGGSGDAGPGDADTGDAGGPDSGPDGGPAPVCGNRVIELGEGCDPPRVGGCGEPSCTAACLVVEPTPACGNGCADADEECGEGGLPDCPAGFACLACTCQGPRCGDGVAQPGESCGEPGRVCNAGKVCVDCQCSPAVCGDGSIDVAEGCGEPGLPACPAGQSCGAGSCRCEVPAMFCGNGLIDLGETCGEPGLGLCGTGRECAGCLCRNQCGNAAIDPGEECGEAGISCPAMSSCNVGTCRCSANCGNAAIDVGETCDPPTAASCGSPTYCSDTCQVTPRPSVAEVCNGRDDDCDGMVDEGLRDICFTCDSTCAVGSAPPPGGWMPGPTNSSGVIVDMDGALTLGHRTTESYALWIANMDEGTVSKLDSRTGHEIALYPTVSFMAPAGTRPWSEVCNWANAGNCPSRTAVDQNFDAYVANRAFGSQGSVTKYANAERDCVDRNMNGVIDTSHDLNGNGVIDRGTAEFVGPTDECILWNVAVGTVNAVPRALAVGVADPMRPVGDVWVGLYNTGQACRLGPGGALIGCVALTVPGGGIFSPYGAAAYHDGRVFFGTISGATTSPATLLVYVNPATMTAGAASDVPGAVGAGSYGMGVDGNDHVWVGGWDSGTLKRYDVPTDSWTSIRPSKPGCPPPIYVRGVAADATYVWATDYQQNVIWQVRISDGATMNCWATPAGTTALAGAGVSFDGSVWAISTNQSIAVRIEVIDPVAGTGVTTSHPVGLHPYTYSDFIGFGLNTFAEPRGFYRYVLTGCGGTQATRWEGLRFSAEVPARTYVEFYVRSADTVAGLAGQPWLGPFTGNPSNLQLAPGPVPDGTYLEVEVRLRTDDRGAAPRVFTVDVAHTCIRPG